MQDRDSKGKFIKGHIGWNKGTKIRDSRIRKNCLSCKNTFLSYASGNHKYCSQKCYHKSVVPYFKLRKIGFSGKENGNWKGGKRLNWMGYIEVLNKKHPYKNHAGYVKQHRLIMERHINRFLLPSEIVHHINGNVKDNRIENLMLLKNQSEHRKVHEQNKEV